MIQENWRALKSCWEFQYQLFNKFWESVSNEIFESSKSKTKKEIAIARKVLNLKELMKHEKIETHLNNIRNNFKKRFYAWYRQSFKKSNMKYHDFVEQCKSKHLIHITEDSSYKNYQRKRSIKINPMSITLEMPLYIFIPSRQDFTKILLYLIKKG